MPRPRTPVVSEVKAKLIARLQDGLHRPGQRFFSNRALARAFGVSYQTAHRLIGELVDEGLLVRRSASGTYVAGPRQRLAGVELVFHPRARRAGSFGARLLEELAGALERAGIASRRVWADEVETLDSRRYPVLWESPRWVDRLYQEKRYGLLLNERARPGLAASLVDSVSVDDFSGGAAAAEVLGGQRARERCGIFAGPEDDERSRRRVEGFLSVIPEARVIPAGTWFYEEARAQADRALRYGRVFCCNDRLAQAVVAVAGECGRPRPQLVGFDDAPISETLNFTTIAIPWREFVAGAVAVIERRLAGDCGTAAQVVLAPRPVSRRG